MHFQNSKTAAVAVAASAVRLPRSVTSTAGLSLLSVHSKGARPALTQATNQRAQYRADQSRYHAKCRVAMSF